MQESDVEIEEGYNVVQHIDSKGKTQVLGWKDIRMLIQPIAPLDNVESQVLSLKPVDINELLDEKNIKIIGQSTSKDRTIGLWVKVSFENDFELEGYIPVNPTTKREYPIIKAPQLANITPSRSEMELFSKNKHIATVLKHYILFDYSIDIPKDNRLVIIPNYEYDFVALDNRLSKNNIMYKDDKLIVPSEQVGKDLLLYLKSQITNNREEVLNYKDRKRISDFVVANDFRHAKGQQVFQGKKELLMWLHKKEAYKQAYRVNYSLKPKTKAPYYYRNNNIFGGRIILMYNTGEDLQKAKYISYWWNKNGVFSTKPVEGVLESSFNIKGPIVESTSANSAVFHYEGDKPTYAAISIVKG